MNFKLFKGLFRSFHVCFLRGGFGALALVAASFGLSNHAGAKDAEPLQAFEAFVKTGDLKAAHFYLENNLIKPEEIETSRLFVEAVMLSNLGDGRGVLFSVRQLPSIELLYNYLGAIHPIDLNGLNKCKLIGTELHNDYVCNLASFLFHIGAPTSAFDFFLARGMNMKAFSGDTLPPVVVLTDQLGVKYGLQELNWFAEKGAPLGPESYSGKQVSGRGGLLDVHYRIELPSDKPDSSRYNFIDILSLSLVNSDLQDRELNRHRDFLCRYIAHVSSQMAPTFDHFSYLLTHVNAFRGSKIDQASHPEQWGMVNREVFPHSCRILIEAMGRSSQKLDAMITFFSGLPDLETAQWLVSLK